MVCAEIRTYADAWKLFKQLMGLWRNGSASDSRSDGWAFESLWPQLFYGFRSVLENRMTWSTPESSSVTAWPSGLRRQLKALVRKGVGSNPTAVIYCIGLNVFTNAIFRVVLRNFN